MKNKNKYALKLIGTKPLTIWGSGFIKDESDLIHSYRKLNILALRGKHSQKILENEFGYDLSHIALGDPGLLMNRLVKPNSDKKYKLGVIPHYIDSDNKLINALIKHNKGATKINILGDPVETLSRINECEIIVSTAMHGLIAADSLGIPNQWIRVSDGVIGGDFKFNDYYSVFNLKPKVMDLRQEKNLEINLETIKANYKINNNMVEEINQRLLQAVKSQ